MDGLTKPLVGALLACLTLIITTTPAAAQSAPQAWTNQARQIADAHWGFDPCHGDIAISWGTLPADQNAISSWLNQHADYGDPDNNTQCSVVFNTLQDWDWPKFCTVFVHEFGHLAGNPHSDDPDDVMFAYYTGTHLPACKAASPAGRRAPTAPRQGHPSPAAKRESRSKAYRAGTTRHPKRTDSRTRRR
jgi:Matrixin